MTGETESTHDDPIREADEGGALCPHCIEPVDDLDHFCPSCGRPITSHAAIDPLGQVYAAGDVYRQATEAPRLVAVIGVWLIFGTQIPVLMFAIFLLGSGTASIDLLALIKVLMVAGLLCLYSAIIWKVTRRYVRNRSWDGRRCLECGYDLRGTRDAGRVQCPECGWTFRDEDSDEPDVQPDDS